MSTRRALAIAAAGALSLSLAACDPGEAEEVDPPTTSSPAPTSEAPPTTEAPISETATIAPAVPPPNPADFPGMDQQTEEGARQTYRYFWAAILYGYQSGETRPLDSVSGDTCEYCSDVKAAIERLRDRGEYWTSTSFTDTQDSVIAISNVSMYVTFDFTLTEHFEPADISGQVESEAPSSHRSIGLLDWTPDGWRVTGIDLDK